MIELMTTIEKTLEVRRTLKTFNIVCKNPAHKNIKCLCQPYCRAYTVLPPRPISNDVPCRAGQPPQPIS